MPKLRLRNVVHVALWLLWLVTTQRLFAQHLPTENMIVVQRSFTVLSNQLIVRMQSSRRMEDVNAVLPPGFRAEAQLLAPGQTRFFSDNPLLKTPDVCDSVGLMMVAAAVSNLRSAEDRLTRTFTLRFDGYPSVSAAMAALRKSDRDEVEIIEPWYLNQSSAGPNDPGASEQTYLQTIRLEEAWQAFRGSDTITIGISDDGVMQAHEDLTTNIATNTGEIPNNGIDDDANGYVDDHRGYNFTWQLESDVPGSTTSNSSFGHGTRVAGLAAAATNNGIGIVGAGLQSRFFPLKTALKDGGGIVFGYQSLIYAAQRGFDVVNCSWGLVKPESAIDQSVIDYCLARGTLVVASAGNHGDDAAGSAFRDRNFPASYDGVLGVGETTPDDFVVSSSGLGRNSRVMAPGNGAYTTESGGSYTANGVSGTSFAAPIVAGVAAVVRARWPALTPRQVAAHIYRTADDITSKNNAIEAFLSPRVNMLRAVTTEPLSHSSMRLASVRQRVSSGSPFNRFRVGDTLLLEFGITNDLAPGSAEVEPRVVDANGWKLRILRERDALGTIATGSTAWTQPFACVLETIGTRPCLIRVDIAGESTIERDWYYLEPPAGLAQFANDSLLYSMSDDGMVGYSSTQPERQGDGFGKKPSFQLLSPSGFFMIEGAEKSVSAFKNDPPYISDFSAVKPFDVLPDAARCRMQDESATSPIGVAVEQTCAFPGQDKAATIWRVEVSPRTADLAAPAAGYLMDWDIGTRGRSNRISTDPEALPPALRSPNRVAHTITRIGYPVAVCVAAISDDPTDVAQSAGFYYATFIDDADGFSHADRVRFLTGGTTITESDEGDIAAVIGMRRGKPLAVGQTWSFRIVITVGQDDESARALMRQVLSTVSVRDQVRSTSTLRVIPNPVRSTATLCGIQSAVRYSIIDQLGRIRHQDAHDGSAETTFDASQLERGAYMVVIETTDHTIHTTHFIR